MEELDALYKKWVAEKNKGHYKEHITQKQNVYYLIGAQTDILNEINERFLSYGIELKVAYWMLVAAMAVDYTHIIIQENLTL